MALHDDADIASSMPVLVDVSGENHVPVLSKGMAYLGYMVMNRGMGSAGLSPSQLARRMKTSQSY